jgi:hypothetical protein
MSQKYQKKKVAIKIRETCEKTMSTPSNPINSLSAMDGHDRPYKN